MTMVSSALSELEQLAELLVVVADVGVVERDDARLVAVGDGHLAADDLVELRIEARLDERARVRLGIVLGDPRHVRAPRDVHVDGAEVHEVGLGAELAEHLLGLDDEVLGLEPAAFVDVVLEDVPAFAEAPERVDEAVAHEPDGGAARRLDRLGQRHELRIELGLLGDEVVHRAG